MKTVILVDDEVDALALLQQYLGEYSDFRVIGQARDGFEAVRLINDRRPDLVFLDIQMPGLNGFEVLTQLNELPTIIFSTAYDQYALKAFEVHALDYLLKPYGRKRFKAALDRLNGTKNTVQLAERLLAGANPFPARIFLQKGQRQLLTDVAHIRYITAFGDYCKVHLANQVLLSNSGISELEAKLDPSHFLRVHRSYLANLRLVTELVKDGRYRYLKFADGDRVKISDSYLGKVKELLY